MKSIWSKFMTWPLWTRTLVWDFAFWLLFLPSFLHSTPGKPNTGGATGAIIGFTVIFMIGVPIYLLRVLLIESQKKRRAKIQYQASALGLATLPRRALNPQQVQQLFTQNTQQGVSSALGVPVNQWCLVPNNDGASGLALDESTNRVCVFQAFKSHPTPSTRVLNAGDILEVSIEENGHTIANHSSQTSTSNGSMVGRAVIGGVLLGPGGAIIGGATAKKQTKGTTVTQDFVQSVTLKILINDTRTPMVMINFLPTPTTRDNPMYQSAAQQASHWYGILTVVKSRAVS